MAILQKLNEILAKRKVDQKEIFLILHKKSKLNKKNTNTVSLTTINFMYFLINMQIINTFFWISNDNNMVVLFKIIIISHINDYKNFTHNVVIFKLIYFKYIK